MLYPRAALMCKMRVMNQTTAPDTGPRLFAAHPGLRDKIPWTPLVNRPTPVQLMERFSRRLGAEVWVKRDDLSCPHYGGNKPRKLEFLLAQAAHRGKKSLVTIGGIGTNHGLATVILGRRQGFKVTLLLFAQPVSGHVRQNLRLYHAHQAEMILCKSFRAADWRYRWLERLKRPGAYFIPAGGSNQWGALGYLEAGLELADQVKASQMPAPRAVFVAAGTCGTIAGLAAGLRLGGVRTRVVGVQVTPPQAANQALALGMANQALALLRRHDHSVPDVSVNAAELVIDTQHYGSGYGAATAAGSRAMELMAETEGIGLEQTYTAKTLAALVDHARDQPGEGPLLYLSTLSSVDLATDAAAVDPRDLPQPFQRFFK